MNSIKESVIKVNENNVANSPNNSISFYEKRKNARFGRCNICKNEALLTWDHVPPKFCFNDVSVKYNSLMEQMDTSSKKSSISQNGIKYRTLCSNCNNNILGANYDKEYRKLVNCLLRLYKNPAESNLIIIQGLKINKVTRAIVGHLLAARLDFEETVTTEDELRKFFLKESALPPKGMKLLYRTYIYNTIVLQRDFTVGKIKNLDFPVPEGFLSILNTFPISFVLASGGENKCNLSDMFELCTTNIEEEIDMKIDLLSYLYPNTNIARDPYWPCAVHDGKTGTDFILTTPVSREASVITNPRQIKLD